MLGNNRTNKTMNFNYVIITNWKDRTSKYTCDNIEGYNKHLAKNPDMCELIGGTYQQIKPILDVDAYETDPNINEILAEINKVFPNKSVYYAKRDPREYKGKIKYSYRFYVDGVRIIAKNLKKLLIKNGFDKNPIYDMSIYDSNKVLFLPLTTQKTDGSKIPPLTPVDCEIFDCCASYIKEEFEDWDMIFKNENIEPEINQINILCDEEESVYNVNLNFTEIMTKLNKVRATEFNDWRDIGFALINLNFRKIISRGQLYDLFDLFSLKADIYDANGVIKFLDINIPRLNGKGYGIKFLLECLKTDDEEYYNSITKKDD
jgi:hypothetical protein